MLGIDEVMEYCALVSEVMIVKAVLVYMHAFVYLLAITHENGTLHMDVILFQSRRWLMGCFNIIQKCFASC